MTIRYAHCRPGSLRMRLLRERRRLPATTRTAAQSPAAGPFARTPASQMIALCCSSPSLLARSGRNQCLPPLSPA